MNPFRPRILTAGCWFLLFLALPFALVRELLKHDLWKSEEKWWFKSVNLFWVYYLSCVAILWGSGFVFDFDAIVAPTAPMPATWKIYVFVAVALLGIVLIAIFRARIPKSLKAIGMGLVIANMIWQGYEALFIRQQFQGSALFLWMFGVGCAVLYEMTVRSWRLRLGDWPQSLTTLLALLTVFATVFYPHIKSSWGGGEPLPISLTLTKDFYALPNQSVACLLIDETDSGFYVVGQTDKHATFIPRAAVASIHFADGSESSFVSPKVK
jgi:hypothetical protein